MKMLTVQEKDLCSSTMKITIDVADITMRGMLSELVFRMIEFS